MNETAEGPPIVDVVVKVGGSLLKGRRFPDEVARALAAVRPRRRLLVVPGGGPFADTVRRLGGRIDLSDSANHWMALLAMDQVAYLMAEHLPGGQVVSTPGEIAEGLRAGHLPVLAPAHWLHEADALPHSWDVTSDSIAAWVAGRVGAGHLVLLKPPGTRACFGSRGQVLAVKNGIVDPYFPRALPARISWAILPVDQLGALFGALDLEAGDGTRNAFPIVLTRPRE
jgi:hypothetical protein